MYLMVQELEELKKKKMEELKKQLMDRGRNMSEEMPDAPLKVTDADFDDAVKKYKTIVIDCWAPWCGPCRMVGPIIDELAKEMQGKIVFGKLNVDENPMTSSNFGIMTIPTLLIFNKGELIDRLIGAVPKEQLKQQLFKYS